MIKVNLLPGGRKRARRGRGAGLKLPSFGGGSGVLQDRWMLAGVLVPLLAVGVAAWLWLGTSAREAEVEVALESAVQDSVRYADVIERTSLLQARSDSIANKISIIQEIDEGRYVWPHVLDEVARAIPDYTWLTQVLQLQAGTEPEIQIAGRAGNNVAVAVFMDQLEASAFLRDVDLLSSEQQVDPATNQVVYNFQLDATYEQPPLEYLQTVPLFGEGVLEPGPAADTLAAPPAGQE